MNSGGNVKARLSIAAGLFAGGLLLAPNADAIVTSTWELQMSGSPQTAKHGSKSIQNIRAKLLAAPRGNLSHGARPDDRA